jgi:hypothetical protein
MKKTDGFAIIDGIISNLLKMQKAETVEVPSLFDIDHTRTRQVESWNAVTQKTQDKQLQMVIGLLKIRPMTSRQLADYSGIERTSITRVMATHKSLFRVENEVRDEETGKNVTLYQLK